MNYSFSDNVWQGCHKHSSGHLRTLAQCHGMEQYVESIDKYYTIKIMDKYYTIKNIITPIH